MKNFIQEGQTVTVPAPYDVASGAALKVAGLFGVANFGALSGAPVEISRTGVFALAKVAGTAITLGAKVYWDDTNKVVTPVATSNTLIGAALLAADAGDATATIVLDGAVR